MIKQAVCERHRKNKRITGLKPKSQQLAMLKFTIAQNRTVQSHPAQITMLKHTTREIKIGEIGTAKINILRIPPLQKAFLKHEYAQIVDRIYKST
jgi:hypothetical protein